MIAFKRVRVVLSLFIVLLVSLPFGVLAQDPPKEDELWGILEQAIAYGEPEPEEANELVTQQEQDKEQEQSLFKGRFFGKRKEGRQKERRGVAAKDR